MPLLAGSRDVHVVTVVRDLPAARDADRETGRIGEPVIPGRQGRDALESPAAGVADGGVGDAATERGRTPSRRGQAADAGAEARGGRPRRGSRMAGRAESATVDARDATAATATSAARPARKRRGRPGARSRATGGVGPGAGGGAGGGPGSGCGAAGRAAVGAARARLGDRGGVRRPATIWRSICSAPAMSRRVAGSLSSSPSITGRSGPAWGDGSSSSATTAVRLASTPSRSNGGLALDRREQRRSQRPQVRGGARPPAAGAFGRKVGRRAEQHARRGQGRAVGGLGDPEVGQHHPALRAEQDVGRFHVPVHHPGLVHRAQGGQHAQADPGRLGRGQRPVLGHGVAQRAERDELHDDAGPVVLLDDVVHADHVRVAEPRGQLRFPHGAAAGDLPLGRRPAAAARRFP